MRMLKVHAEGHFIDRKGRLGAAALGAEDVIRDSAN